MSQWTYLLDPNYRSARVDDQGHSRRVRYQVQTNQPDLDEADIQQDSGFRWGDADPLDSTKFVRSIEVSRDAQNPYYWQLVLEYRSDVQPGYGPGQNLISPLMRAPEFDWSYEETEEPVDIDVSGNPICTAAGERFDPPLTRPFVDLVATVTFYRDSWNASAMMGLVNTVNADVWYGWPRGTARFFAPRVRSVIEFPWPMCFQITYTFKVRPDGWKDRKLHAGTREWTGTYDSNGNKVTRLITDANGQPISDPWPLDVEGRKIELQGNGQYAAALTFREFDKFNAIPFAVFGV